MACIPLMLCVKPIHVIFFSHHGHGKTQEEVEMQEGVGGDYATSDDDFQRVSNYGDSTKALKSEDDVF